MKEHKFLPLNDRYLQREWEAPERAFERTMIAGWEKRHYIPDAYRAYAELTEAEQESFRKTGGSEFHFLTGRDKTVYIAPDDEFVLLVSRQDDVLSMEFIFDEDSEHEPDATLVFEEWKRATAIRSELCQIRDKHAPIFVVSELPDKSSFTVNAYYLVHNGQSTTLYYVNSYEQTIMEIEPRADRSEAFKENIVRLLKAVQAQNNRLVSDTISTIDMQAKNKVPNTAWQPWGSDDLRETETSKYNTMVRFESSPVCYGDPDAPERKFDFTKLKASLDVFRRHCTLPDAVVDDVHRVLDAHKERFLSHKVWLANRLNDDPEGMLIQIKAIFDCHGSETRFAEYYFSIIKWYAEQNCMDTAIALQKSMPLRDDNKKVYIQMTQYIMDRLMLMRDKNLVFDRPAYRAYLGRLSEISLVLADATKEEEDLSFAMRILSQLCGDDGFSPDMNVDRSHLYLSLVVKYATQVGQLKEEIKARNMPVAATALVAAPRANEPSKPALAGRPRRNSLPF